MQMFSFSALKHIELRSELMDQHIFSVTHHFKLSIEAIRLSTETLVVRIHLEQNNCVLFVHHLCEG